MLASLMSCGTSSSPQQRQRISCNSVMSVSLQHFSTSAGIPSFPGALPEARESRTSLSSSVVGSLSSSSSSGRHSMAFSDYIFPCIKLSVVFYPALHLSFSVLNRLPCG